MLFLKFKKLSIPDDSLLQGQNVLRQTASIQLKCVVECMCVFSKKLFSMEKLVSKSLHECDVNHFHSKKWHVIAIAKVKNVIFTDVGNI